MEKIPTAKEYIEKNLIDYWEGGKSQYTQKDVEQAMIEFAKMHVKLSKNEINSNILHKELSVDWDIFDESGMLLLDDDGIKDFKKTVSSSYQLKNIK
jgi:hypothetical protein